jgi:hypothetical protein
LDSDSIAIVMTGRPADTVVILQEQFKSDPNPRRGILLVFIFA